MYKILITDPISSNGFDILNTSEIELIYKPTFDKEIRFNSA